MNVETVVAELEPGEAARNLEVLRRLGGALYDLDIDIALALGLPDPATLGAAINACKRQAGELLDVTG